MILVLVTVFVATIGLLVGGYVYLNRRSLAAADLARERLRTTESAVRARPLLKEERVSELAFLNDLLKGRDWIDRLASKLERSGSSVTPGAFLLIVGTSGLAATWLGTRFGGLPMLALTVVGWGAPFYWLRRRHRKRLHKFESQLPDAIDMLVSAMRAGYSFQSATQVIGQEMPDPLGPEFARFYEEQRLGVDVRAALTAMQDRVDSLDLKMFVTAVLIQRETGGNLSEVLSGLADLVRSRIALRGHIETLVAEPKMSAKFLAIMPGIVFLLLSFLNPNFMRPLLETGPGRMMLMGSIISIFIGYTIMMKIADVDI